VWGAVLAPPYCLCGPLWLTVNTWLLVNSLCCYMHCAVPWPGGPTVWGRSLATQGRVRTHVLWAGGRLALC